MGGVKIFLKRITGRGVASQYSALFTSTVKEDRRAVCELAISVTGGLYLTCLKKSSLGKKS